MYDKDQLRKRFGAAISPLVSRLDALEIKPTHITVAGLIFTLLACFAYYEEAYGATFLLMTIGRFADAIDGAFARLTNQMTTFGGFVDSMIDRYGEFLIVGTILFVYRDDPSLYYFSFVVFLGISLMSYSRALYDKYGIACPGNPFEYFERGILMVAFFLLGRLDWWLIVIAIGTNAFVLHRIYHFYHATRQE
jgi:archaetidylinositol phosphate synthase